MGTNSGIIICAGFLGFFFLFFGTRALTRWFQHRERMAMIAHGLVPNDVVKETVKKRDGKGALTWGIVVIALSLTLMCSVFFLIPSRVGGDSGDSIRSLGPLLLPGLGFLFMGIALIIIYLVTRSETTAESVEETLSPVEVEEMSDLPALEFEADEGPPEE